MKCFNHPAAEAVGTCKHCCKGMCDACAKDSGWGLVCSQACEDEVKAVRAMVERNRKMLPFAAKNSVRSAIILFAMAAVFIGFGLAMGGPISVYMISFGVIMLVGGGFAMFNSRRLAKM
jgi:hypothetical protein